MAKNLHLIDHGLATHKLSVMRDKTTKPNLFRRLVRQTSSILCSEMTRDLDLQEREVETPNDAVAKGQFRDQGGIVIMPILRAGLVMAESFADLMPMARTAHIGIYRSQDGQSHCYMLSLPRTTPDTKFFVLDVTVSRGRTLSTAVKYLIDAGIPASHIRCGCILVSEEGIDQFHKIYPDIEVFAVGQDLHINNSGHIIPGVGNPSARMFRTHETNTADLEGVFE